MTNLVEKTLLTAFGIFLLISFLSLVLPFWNQIFNFNINSRQEYEKYSIIISEVDQGIIFISENPEEIYQKHIDYPEKLNISVTGWYIKYDYILRDQLMNTIVEYQFQLLANYYRDLNSRIYVLKIFYEKSLIIVQID